MSVPIVDTGNRVPQPGGLVVARAGQPRPVRAEFDVPDRALMPHRLADRSKPRQRPRFESRLPSYRPPAACHRGYRPGPSRFEFRSDKRPERIAGPRVPEARAGRFGRRPQASVPSGLIAMALTQAVILMTGPIGSRVAAVPEPHRAVSGRGDEHRPGRVERELEVRAGAMALRVRDRARRQGVPEPDCSVAGSPWQSPCRRAAPPWLRTARGVLHRLADPAVAAELPDAGDVVVTAGTEHSPVRAESDGADGLLMGQRVAGALVRYARSTTGPCCRRQPPPAASHRG